MPAVRASPTCLARQATLPSSLQNFKAGISSFLDYLWLRRYYRSRYMPSFSLDLVSGNWSFADICGRSF